MANAAQLLQASVESRGDRPAVKLDDTVLNYAVVDAGVRPAAGMLREKGIGPGDRVGLQLPNVPYFPVAFFGILRLGAIGVPMIPLLKDREVGFQRQDSGAKVLLAGHQFAEAAEGGAKEAGAECV